MDLFWLFCAGEDSGDILGESVVCEIREKGFSAVGAGGARMQHAGLKAVVPFDELPVNGFADVIFHAKKLKQHLCKLQKLLLNEKCQGLVAMDYPGFNLKLMQLALRLGKRIIYVEPPQIWAWNPRRVRFFLSPEAKKRVELRSCYRMNVLAYQKYGLPIRQIEHPFAAFSDLKKTEAFSPKEILLLPGSRVSQAKRNLSLYRKVAQKFREKKIAVRFVASRKEVQKFLEENIGEFPVVLSPVSTEERFLQMMSAKAVVCGPGSAASEAKWAGTFCVVASRIELWTFLMGKLFLRTRHIAMPNIEADSVGERPPFPEFVQSVLSNESVQAQKIFQAIESR